MEPATGFHRYLDRAPYLHNGTDVQAPLDTRVFTIEDGIVRNIRPRGDFASVWIGDYRYVHISLQPWLSEQHWTMFDRANHRRMFVPAGTFIGTTKALSTSGMRPHLHLQRETPGGGFFNALQFLAPWSDAFEPEFKVRTDGAAWNRPAVRIVREFEPGSNTEAPDQIESFQSLSTLDDARRPISVIDGTVAILARVKDNLSTTQARLPAGSSIALSETNSIPTTVGFSMSPADLPNFVLTGSLGLPMRINVNFTEHIPFGEGADGADSGSARAASADYFHKVYWVDGQIGTVSGPPRVRDFILTNHRDQLLPVATDDVTMRNGRYVIHVEAGDLGGNTANTSRTVAVCNPPVANTAIRGSSVPPASPGEFHPGDMVLLSGHNFFTPLGATTQLEWPKVALLTVTNGVTERARGIPLLEPVAASGTNVLGSVLIQLPTSGLTPTQVYHAAPLIRCDPTTPQGSVDETEWTSDGRTHPALRIAENVQRASISLIYLDADPESGDLRIRRVGGDRVPQTLSELNDHGEFVFITGMDVSDDGLRYAYTISALDLEGGREVLAVHSIFNPDPLLIATTSMEGTCGGFDGPPSLDAHGMHVAYRTSRGGPSDGSCLPERIEVSSVSANATPSVVLPPDDGLSNPLLSPGGDVVVAQVGASVFRTHVASGATPEVLTIQGGMYLDPQFGPPLLNDGTTVIQDYAGHTLLWGPDGTRTFPADLRPDARFVSLTGLSRDGSVGLAYLEGLSGENRLEVIKMEPPSYPLIRAIPVPDEVYDSRFSPDGRSVALVIFKNFNACFPPFCGSATQYDIDVIDVLSGGREKIVRDAWFPDVDFLGRVVEGPLVIMRPGS